jgi:hypothetical protein
MALLLGAYCISSIRAARRDVKHGVGMPAYQNPKRGIHAPAPASATAPNAETGRKTGRAEAEEEERASWIVQQLEKKREEERVREGARRVLRGEGEERKR